MEKSIVHVSKMTGKLEGFLAINFDPTSSKFCEKMRGTFGTICNHCYSFKAISSYRKSCAAPFRRNAELMSSVLHYSQIPRFVPGSRVRFLAHGDMDNIQQLYSFMAIANDNPEVSFTIWTKRKDLVAKVAEARPSNMKFIQSSPYVNEPENLSTGFDAVFTVYDNKDKMPPEHFVCSGKKCLSCMYCYSDVSGHIAELLRK